MDLKTIHNWARIAEKDPRMAYEAAAICASGASTSSIFSEPTASRFPDALREQSVPRVVAVDADRDGLGWMRRVLARRFELATFEHVVDGLVALTQSDPDVALFGDLSPLDAQSVAMRLRSVEGDAPRTRRDPGPPGRRPERERQQPLERFGWWRAATRRSCARSWSG